MHAPTPEQRSFFEGIRACVPIAEAAGVPGTVFVAQAAIESGWGRSGLTRLGHAYFGVKARPGWGGIVYSGTTKEWIRGQGYVTVPGTNRIYAGYDEAIADGCNSGSLFRAYGSFEENVRDYVQFFHGNTRYHLALENYARTRDPRRFAMDIASAGYATSPTYAKALIAVMERYTPDLLPPVPTAIRVLLNNQPLPPERVRVIDGRVFVHVRPLAATLGMRVEYNSRTATVRIEEGRR